MNSADEGLAKRTSKIITVPYLAEGCTFDANPSFINNQLPWFEIASNNGERAIGRLSTIPQDLVSMDTNYQLVIRNVHNRDNKSRLVRLNQRLSRGNCLYLSIDRYEPKYKALVGKFQDYFVNIAEEKIRICPPKDLIGKLAFVLITSIGRNHSYAAAQLLNIVPKNEVKKTLEEHKYRIILVNQI